jgi:hypothetical protein
VTDPSRYVFEPLWEDEEFVLSRSVREAERSPLLVVTPALARPAPVRSTPGKGTETVLVVPHAGRRGSRVAPGRRAPTPEPARRATALPEPPHHFDPQP